MEFKFPPEQTLSQITSDSVPIEMHSLSPSDHKNHCIGSAHNRANNSHKISRPKSHIYLRGKDLNTCRAAFNWDVIVRESRWDAL